MLVSDCLWVRWLYYPGRWSLAVRGVGGEVEQVVEALLGGVVSVSMRRARGRPLVVG